LTAFALAAAVSSLLGLWARTNDILAPSIAHQRSVLRQMGYDDSNPMQAEMLKYLQFGLVPAGMTESQTHAGAKGVLYADVSSNVCDALQRTTTPEDAVVLLHSDPSTKKLADAVAALPQNKRAAAPEWIKLLLCHD
jgi:hypothetical protein